MESDSEKVIEDIKSIMIGFEEGAYRISRIGLGALLKENLLVYKLFFKCKGGEGSSEFSHEFPNARGLIISLKEVRDYLYEGGLDVEVLSA